MSAPPITTKIVDLGTKNPAEVAMVLDVSGSMNRKQNGVSKLELVQAAAIKFIGIMRLAKDSLGLCSFNTKGTVEWAASDKVKLLKDDSTRDQAMNAVEELRAAGDTDIEQGLDLASKMFTQFKPSNKAVILLSDWKDNRGGKHKEKQIAKELNAAGKKVYTVAVSKESDRALLKELAGSGERYNYIDGAFNAQKVFNRIIGQVGIADVLHNEVVTLGSSDLHNLNTPLPKNTVPAGKTTVLIAIAWDKPQYACLGVNSNPLLKEGQIAFNVGKVSSSGASLDYPTGGDLSTEIKAGKGLVFAKISNAKKGERYGVEMQKHRKIKEDIRFSVGVFA